MIDYKQAQYLLRDHARSFRVDRRPGIALLTTGDEGVPAAVAPSGVQICNSNRWLIGAALQKNGFNLSACEHSTDDPMLLKTKIAGLLSHDVLILCGGVSAGDADHVPAILESLPRNAGPPKVAGEAPFAGNALIFLERISGTYLRLLPF